MASSKISDEFARFASMIREKNGWDDALREFAEKYKFKASDELLLLAIPDDPENGDAFWAICHYVEAEPHAAYIARLIRLSLKMEKVCPDTLRFLIRRVIRSEKCCPMFRTAIREASTQKQKLMLGIIQEYITDFDEHPNPVVEKRCKQLVAELS